MNAPYPIDEPNHTLQTRVQETYERVARNPYGRYYFHRGPYYARYYLGYEGADLQTLPKVAADRFTGVGNPFAAGDIRPGETVLDLGCGAGTDLLIAARRVGPSGRVIGVDASPTMRRCAEMAARAAGLAERVEIREGQCEALPVADASVDLVIANGVLSFAAERAQVFAETRRVLKPGGRLHLAELVLARPLAFDAEGGADQWAACLADVMLEEELPELAARAGLRQGKLVGCYDCLRNTPAMDDLPGGVKVHGVTFFATR